MKFGKKNKIRNKDDMLIASGIGYYLLSIISQNNITHS